MSSLRQLRELTWVRTILFWREPEAMFWVFIFPLILAAVLGGAQTALGQGAAVLGVALFATTTIFTLVTLPVEFDASRRALAALESGGFVNATELTGARKVLNAAALTYVAAFITSPSMRRVQRGRPLARLIAVKP